MSFIVETPPILIHKPHVCDTPNEVYIDNNGDAQPSYAHLTIWQCDACKKYWLYKDYRKNWSYPLLNWWKTISEKKAMKITAKWLRKRK